MSCLSIEEKNETKRPTDWTVCVKIVGMGRRVESVWKVDVANLVISAHEEKQTQIN